jgi:hypothetical protein
MGRFRNVSGGGDGRLWIGCSTIPIPIWTGSISTTIRIVSCFRDLWNFGSFGFSFLAFLRFLLLLAKLD